MRSSRPRYTLLIPTFNRPACLRSLVGYLAARRFEYPIRVLDSSSAEALTQNLETVARADLDIVHCTYDPAIPVHKKVELGILPVESTYCSFCADDDILFTDQLNHLLDRLDDNPSFVLAHGYYVNFTPGRDFDLSYTVYSAPSNTGDDALKRIVWQMSDYQANFYAVHRTIVMKSILARLDSVRSLWAQEMLTSSLALIAGDACRVPHYFMARNTSPSIATAGFHPYQFFAAEPAELFREYSDYRAVVLEALTADSQCRAIYQPEQIQRVFDLVSLRYLAPMLAPAVLEYFIEQSMRSDVTPGEIVDGVWPISANPAGASGAGRRRHLARLRALCDPGYATRIVKCVSRIAGLYGALKFQADFEVSLNLSLSRMTVDRTRRDGQPRRYVLTRALLNQELADGCRLTSSHLRDIIRQLDDYV